MLNYNKLKKLALEFQNNNISGFKLAKHLNIETKTESEMLNGAKDKNSLLNCSPAFLAVTNKFVICYNPKTAYLDYYIFHECSHYILKHNEDDPNNELEADILTCLIIAPPKELIEHNFYKTEIISKMYSIPSDKAELYIRTLLENDKEYTYAFNLYFTHLEKKEKLGKKQYRFRLLITILYAFTIILFFTLFINKDTGNNNQDMLGTSNPTTTHSLLQDKRMKVSNRSVFLSV